jgi:hypothetical protein
VYLMMMTFFDGVTTQPLPPFFVLTPSPSQDNKGRLSPEVLNEARESYFFVPVDSIRSRQHCRQPNAKRMFGIASPLFSFSFIRLAKALEDSISSVVVMIVKA